MASPDDANPPPDWGSRNGFFGRRVTMQSPNEALQPEAAPPPPPMPPARKRPRLSAFSGFLSFLLIVAVVAMFGVAWGVQRFSAPGSLPADKVVIVPRGDLLEITTQLEREGVIDNAMIFNAALVLQGKSSKLKEGEYLFKQNASMHDVMDTLVGGKQVLHAVTLPEGLTSEQIVQRLSESDVLGGDVRDTPKEGSLLPETYKVTRGTSRSDLLKKMQDDQRKVVDQIWARRASDLPLHSPYELIILASIVEKETGKADERPRVAGVFMNRLQKRMRLQSDPTIVYGLVGGKGSLGHSISRAELDKFTPYNTYTIDGLPPGPIANPGRAALEAVANPSRTQDLYFVADGSGGHVFAETIDQHTRNVQRWRQIEKDAKDKVSPDVQPAAAKPGQRSDLSNSVYGALPDSIDGAAPVSLARRTAETVVAGLGPASVGQPEVKTPPTRSSKPVNFDIRGFSDLGITVLGPNGKESASDMLDGAAPPVQPSDLPASLTAFSSGAFRQADRQDRKQHAALAAGPAGSNAALDNLTGDPALSAEGSALPAQRATPPEHPKIYDVSEGTPLDPLLDKTFDLNHPKTVPSMK